MGHSRNIMAWLSGQSRRSSKISIPRRDKYTKTRWFSVWCFTLTVGDKQEDKSFILYQVDDGLLVGVIPGRRIW